MMKLLKLVTIVLTIALIAIPVSAAVLPDDGAEMGPETDKYYYLTADAKADLPNDYSRIYGIQFDVALDEGSVDTTFGTGDIYWTVLYVDNGSEATAVTTHFATASVVAIFSVLGVTLTPVTDVTIAAGETKTVKYVGDAAFFSSGASMAKARLALGAGAVSLGMKYGITNIKWLDSAGNVVTAQTTSTSDSPSTGDNAVYFYLAGIFAAAAAAIVLRKKTIKVN